MLTIKLRSEKKGDHIYDTVFIGKKGETLQNAGTVIFSNEAEWGLFGAIMLMGAKHVATVRHLQNEESDVEVVLEGWTGADDLACPRCSGHGSIWTPSANPLQGDEIEVVCPDCHGTKTTDPS